MCVCVCVHCYFLDVFADGKGAHDAANTADLDGGCVPEQQLATVVLVRLGHAPVDVLNQRVDHLCGHWGLARGGGGVETVRTSVERPLKAPSISLCLNAARADITVERFWSLTSCELEWIGGSVRAIWMRVQGSKWRRDNGV